MFLISISGSSSRYSGQYDKIAGDQAPIYLEHNEDVFQDEISKLIQTFDREPVQQFLVGKRTKEGGGGEGTDKTCCVVCRQPAAKNRCS